MTADELFGRRTGSHTHPATHPLWLTFADDLCPVCHPEVSDHD